MLFPEEAAHVQRAVPKRVQEFAAGRLCARRALAEFGINDFVLPVAADRQPLWPAAIVGSISHTTGLCVAVVAQRERVAALGVDSEIVGQAGIDIWPTICGPVERIWVNSLPADQRPAAVTLLFSAKEAFYKCQYPIAQEWLDFHDLRVEPLDWGSERAGFIVHATRPLKVANHTGGPVTGQYLFRGDVLTTGVALGRAQMVVQ